nr:MAG TPA_asm: hypothetical protein [Bacteriophage sp.]
MCVISSLLNDNPLGSVICCLSLLKAFEIYLKSTLSEEDKF